jgi:hypothetical protein
MAEGMPCECPFLSDGLCGDCMRAGGCLELPPADPSDGFFWFARRSGAAYVHDGVAWRLVGIVVGGQLP